MIICHKKEELRHVLDGLALKNQTLGFVPTMGALHEGHLSLIDKGLQENAKMVVSIFVNPTQFDNASDLKKYPRTLESDIEMLKSLSEDILVYAPTVEDVYGDAIASETFDFDGLEHQMEGKFRKGHFDGVGTIVKRLFEIVKPDFAYFGEKDFQQLRIIQKLVEKHNLGVTVVGCDIFRAEDGLAMSSRNQRLTKEHREVAPFIFQTLTAAKAHFGTENAEEVTKWVEEQFKKHELLELEYFTIADEETLQPVETKEKSKSYRAFIAVFAGDIRLIDNIALN
ncbi:pantoate--beta-alanine ligase [uncultured Gelidibacter sp.]|uniref:pantoate--beta-alanine ligase n=1 Tax=uncultured Gelidibacter sp. TaxID=259318 RepID=UPI00261AB007|nr:pantoate--beta-alanine ligase [uncultured Gelidibacter sp.]